MPNTIYRQHSKPSWDIPETDLVPRAEAGGMGLEQLDTYIRYGVAGLVALVLLFIAKGQLKKTQSAWEAEQARRKEEERLEQERLSKVTPEDAVKQEEERRLSLRQEIQNQIMEDPDAAASVLRGWIHSA